MTAGAGQNAGQDEQQVREPVEVLDRVLDKGVVIDVKEFSREAGDDLSPGVTSTTSDLIDNVELAQRPLSSQPRTRVSRSA